MYGERTAVMVEFGAKKVNSEPGRFLVGVLGFGHRGFLAILSPPVLPEYAAVCVGMPSSPNSCS